MVMTRKEKSLTHSPSPRIYLFPQTRRAASETVSITAVGGIAAAIFGAMLSREAGTSIVVSTNEMLT